jgi:hypothetical protein
VRAFQGFEADDMRRIARVHAAALRPGGLAVFETMNVQGDERNQLEDALLDAGLVVPLNESERWYRAVLASTGIPFGFILGRPIVKRWDYEPKPGDQATLNSFAAEYHARQEREARETEALLKDPSTKTACVVYSTG